MTVVITCEHGRTMHEPCAECEASGRAIISRLNAQIARLEAALAAATAERDEWKRAADPVALDIERQAIMADREAALADAKKECLRLLSVEGQNQLALIAERDAAIARAAKAETELATAHHCIGEWKAYEKRAEADNARLRSIVRAGLEAIGYDGEGTPRPDRALAEVFVRDATRALSAAAGGDEGKA